MRPLETSSTSSIVVRYSHCPFRQTSVLQFVGTKSDSNRIETEGGGDLNWPGEEEKRNHAPPYPRRGQAEGIHISADFNSFVGPDSR